MTFKVDGDYPGYPPIESVSAVFPTTFGFTWDPNFILAGSDPTWGAGEFLYARCGGAIRNYGLCTLTPAWDATLKVVQYNMVECPNTANLGRSVYVYMGNVAGTTGQYAWFATSGTVPVNGTASVAADTAAGITAAGQIGAVTAGKSLLGARVVAPATTTVVTNVTSGNLGDTTLGVGSVAGLFIGGYVSGTGIPAASTITSLDPISKTIGISAALTAAATGNVTQTANNGTIFYNLLTFNRMTAQGPIT